MVYDLLDPEREIKDIEDLPKVLVREDEDGNLVFGNLRLCKVDNEEDALSLVRFTLQDIHDCFHEDVLG